MGNEKWGVNRSLYVRPNSCTPPFVNIDWLINCTDNCYWNLPLEVPANMTIDGTGFLTINNTMRFTSTDQSIFHHAGCELRIESGGEIAG